MLCTSLNTPRGDKEKDGGGDRGNCVRAMHFFFKDSWKNYLSVPFPTMLYRLYLINGYLYISLGDYHPGDSILVIARNSFF